MRNLHLTLTKSLNFEKPLRAIFATVSEKTLWALLKMDNDKCACGFCLVLLNCWLSKLADQAWTRWQYIKTSSDISCPIVSMISTGTAVIFSAESVISWETIR